MRDPRKMLKTVKPLVGPLLLSSEMGLKTAKFGVRLAPKPIRKTLLKEPEKIVTEITAADLKKMMLNSAHKIVLHQEEINRINVFPVADKDTGYNLAATLLGVAGVISHQEYKSLRELSRDTKDAAVTNARGNAGMIFAGYLIRVLDQIKHLKSVNAQKLALAMRKGVEAAYRSIGEPIEGTILDVIKAAGEAAHKTAKTQKEKNIMKILESAKKDADSALAQTKEKLAVLKENNVVDAGALGFVRILEAWVETLKGVNLPVDPQIKPLVLMPKNVEKTEEKYESVFKLEKISQENLEELKKKLMGLGKSSVVVGLKDQIKVHLHTNFPRKVRKLLKNLKILEWKTEEVLALVKNGGKKKPLGLVVGQTADLPRDFLEKYQIGVVPFIVRFPDGTILSEGDIFPVMREALEKGRPLPTTSAPSFQTFLEVYQNSLRKFEKILVITLTSRLSGTYSQARVARSILTNPEKDKVVVFDCFNVEVGEALIAIRAQEMISQGKKMEEILEELNGLCPKLKLLLCLGDFRYIIKGGRLKLPGFIIPLLAIVKKISLQFLIEIKDGKLKLYGVRFGNDLPAILAKEVEKMAGKKKIRAAIGHADYFQGAKELEAHLEKRPKTEVLFISPVSTALGVHAGPDSLVVAFHPVD